MKTYYKTPKNGSFNQGGEDSIWRHLAAIAVLGRMGLRPKTAMAARWRQIEPSPP